MYFLCGIYLQLAMNVKFHQIPKQPDLLFKRFIRKQTKITPDTDFNHTFNKGYH
jgi:hypothetical protein